MPVNSYRLKALVDYGHRDLVAFVPDKVWTRRLTVDEPGIARCAVRVVCAIGNL
jgi:hypothetical protein